VLETVASLVELPDTDFATFTQRDFQIYLGALRIAVGAHKGIAERTLLHPAAKREIMHARRLLDQTTAHENLKQAVNTTTHTVTDTPIDFKTELGRDRAAVLLLEADIDGDPHKAKQAEETLFDISQITTERTAGPTAAYEAARLRYRREKTKGALYERNKLFVEAWITALDAGNGERAATIAARHLADSLFTVHPIEALKANHYFTLARRHDPSVARFRESELIKKIVQPVRKLIWNAQTFLTRYLP
jgi:hypothetical protein